MNTEQIIALLEKNITLTEETWADESVTKTYTITLTDADWAAIKGDK